MKRWNQPFAAAAIGILGLQVATVTPALADETAAESVAQIAEAIVDPSCIADAVADEAVAEGVRRGRRLLNRLGISGMKPSEAAVPCGAAATAVPPTTAAPAASAAATAVLPATQATSVAASPAGAGAQTAPAPATPARERQQQAQTSGRRDCGALGAGCANGLQPLIACVNEVTFWGEMADAVERKRNTETGLAAVDAAAMDADIAAMRAAHAAGAGQVEPVDPAKPNRHIDWLAPEEYSQAATAAAAKITARRQECNQKHTGF